MTAARANKTDLESAKGNQVTINFGQGKSALFTAGGSKRFLVDPVHGDMGHITVNAIFQLADGSRAYGVLELDESSSGEHSGTGIFLPDGTLTYQDEGSAFLSKLGRAKGEVFPYRYKYTATINTSDHHVDDEGWSIL